MKGQMKKWLIGILLSMMFLNLFLPTRVMAAEATVTVTGSELWEDVKTRIDDAILGGADSVKVVGSGENPTIVFRKDPSASYYDSITISLQTPTTFSNLTFYQENRWVTFFANGNKLTIEDSVTSSFYTGSGTYYTHHAMTIYGGSQNADISGSTNLDIRGGQYQTISGGGDSGDTGATNIYIGPKADVQFVYGGSKNGNTNGDITIDYASQVDNGFNEIYGSGHDDCQQGQKEAKTKMTGDRITVNILSGAFTKDVYGFRNSAVECTDGIYINVEEGAYVQNTVAAGGTYYPEAAYNYPVHYQAKANVHITFDGEGRKDSNHLNSLSIYGGGVFADITGNIELILNGTAEYVYGGSANATVNGDVNVTINGSVNPGGHNADIEIGEVPDYWYGGYVLAGGIDSTIKGNVHTVIGKDAQLYSVVGGSADGKVNGQTQVDVYGTVLKNDDYEKNADWALAASGSVFGGGMVGSSDSIESNDVTEGTYVYIHEGADVQGDVFGGGFDARVTGENNEGYATSVYVSGKVGDNVYGGSLLQESTHSYDGYPEIGFIDGNTYVELNGSGSATDVYGGGVLGNVYGGSTIVMKDNASAENIYGTGNCRGGLYYNQTWYDVGPIEITTRDDVDIHIQDNAKVGDTIYGYETAEVESTANPGETTVHKMLGGIADVYFEHSNGQFKRVENADLVKVTDNSKVTIDNSHTDNAQLVNVTDLTLEENSILTLSADAHILGDYMGDAGQTATLKIAAGKCLTADQTVTKLTKISIYDYNSVTPEAEQVYVVSGAGSTTADGDFQWIDERNDVHMEWKDNGDGTTQWWLVAGDDTPSTELVKIPFEKKWNDGGDTSGRGSVTVQLQYNDGTAADPDWKTVSDDSGNDFTFTLDGTVDTAATEIVSGITVKETEAWKGLFENLPRYDGDKVVSYRVIETNSPAGYIYQGISGNMEDGFTLTNTKHTSFTATKLWRPTVSSGAKATFQLYRSTDGSKYGDKNSTAVKVDGVSVVLDGTPDESGEDPGPNVIVFYEADPGWVAVFDHLPAYAADGTAYTYSVAETTMTPEGYRTVYKEVTTNTNDGTQSQTILNTVTNSPLKDSGDHPETGDAGDPALWTFLLLASAGALLVIRRHRHFGTK